MEFYLGLVWKFKPNKIHISYSTFILIIPFVYIFVSFVVEKTPIYIQTIFL